MLCGFGFGKSEKWSSEWKKTGQEGNKKSNTVIFVFVGVYHFRVECCTRALLLYFLIFSFFHS